MPSVSVPSVQLYWPFSAGGPGRRGNAPGASRSLANRVANWLQMWGEEVLQIRSVFGVPKGCAEILASFGAVDLTGFGCDTHLEWARWVSRGSWRRRSRRGGRGECPSTGRTDDCRFIGRVRPCAGRHQRSVAKAPNLAGNSKDILGLSWGPTTAPERWTRRPSRPSACGTARGRRSHTPEDSPGPSSRSEKRGDPGGAWEEAAATVDAVRDPRRQRKHGRRADADVAREMHRTEASGLRKLGRGARSGPARMTGNRTQRIVTVGWPGVTPSPRTGSAAPTGGAGVDVHREGRCSCWAWRGTGVADHVVSHLRQHRLLPARSDSFVSAGCYWLGAPRFRRTD